jgi:hypothetical protein
MKFASDLAKIKSHQLQIRKLDQEEEIDNPDKKESDNAAFPVPLQLALSQPLTQLLPLPIPLLFQEDKRDRWPSRGAQDETAKILDTKVLNEQARKSIQAVDEKPEEKKIKDDLTEFVEVHVVLMLKLLYAKIECEEEKLQLQDASNLDRSRKWMRMLLSASPSHPHLPGPVGERPLHVCALSAYRFGHIDVLGQGNYMKDGILNGMKKFVGSDRIGRRQAHVPYGKDYCGLVFTFIKQHNNKDLQDYSRNEQLEWGKPESKTQSPPFWSALKHEFEECKTDSFGKDKCSRKREMLILGIYEGETIAHPMIASGDARTLRWILTDDERGKFDEGTRVDSVGQIKQRLTAACYSLVFFSAYDVSWFWTAWYYVL